MSDQVESTEAADHEASAEMPTLPPAPAPETGASAAAWPWRALARPAALSTPLGVVEGASVAAMDVAIAAAHRAMTRTLERPVALEAVSGSVSPADARGFGVVIQSKEPALETLIVLDQPAVRLLATTMALGDEGMAIPSSPGPAAEPGAVERGLVEYLTLVLFDRVLREVHPDSTPPKIAAFCDEGQTNVWLTKRRAEGFGLRLSLLGETGNVSIHVHGWSDEQRAAMQRSLAAMARPQLNPTALDVRLALPAVSLQPEELDAMEIGDVILLGGPSLTSLPQACELVTDTHWSLGPAQIVHDTPTYVNLRWRLGEASSPGIRLAAMQVSDAAPVLQMLVGRATVPIDQIAAATQDLELSLSKDAAAPVDIMLGVTRIARGEFVVIGSEVGVRVLPVDDAPPEVPADAAKTDEAPSAQEEPQ